jgi:hypothetical protein
MPFPRLPQPIVVAPEDVHVIEAAKDAFFAAILQYLGYVDASAQASFAEVVVKEMVRRDPGGAIIQSDDYLTMLFVQDVLVAMVINRRNDGNYCEVGFARFLTSRIVSQIRFKDGSGPSVTVRDNLRIDSTDCTNPEHIYDLRAAVAMAAVLTYLIDTGTLGARSIAGDVLLMWRSGTIMSPAEARDILEQFGLGGNHDVV